MKITKGRREEKVYVSTVNIEMDSKEAKVLEDALETVSRGFALDNLDHLGVVNELWLYLLKLRTQR